jgi:hypothetical protein
MGTWIRIHLAVLDPDPDWECGAQTRHIAMKRIGLKPIAT